MSKGEKNVFREDVAAKLGFCAFSGRIWQNPEMLHAEAYFEEEVSGMKDDKNTFEGIEDVASMTECTGLMPVLPMDEEQDANYAELYAVHKSRRNHKMKTIHK